MNIKVFTAFSGYDSQCLALDRLAADQPDFTYELVGWSEVDKYAIQAHDALYPEAADLNLGDISKIDWAQAPDFDLFTYSFPCFVAGTLVKTAIGFKPIEEVEVGESVLTHTGRYQKVLRTMCRLYQGDLYTIKTMCAEPIRCTDEHPFYVRRRYRAGHEGKRMFEPPRWVKANALTADHYVGIPVSLYKTARPPKCVIEGRVCNQRDTYTIVFKQTTDKQDKAFHDNEYVWYPINSITREFQCVDVYNLEVEVDNSYTANGVSVHNCQDISTAGLQRGFTEGSGTRSGLLWECRKAIEAKRPRFLLMENVKALVQKKFLPEFQRWQDCLAGLGYRNFWKVMNAKDYGVPQNRERVFMVSILDPAAAFEFPDPFPLDRRLKDVLEDEVSESYYLAQEKVDKILANCARKQWEGCGFDTHSANPKDTEGGGKTSRCIATMQGQRETDTYIKDTDQQ